MRIPVYRAIPSNKPMLDRHLFTPGLRARKFGYACRRARGPTHGRINMEFGRIPDRWCVSEKLSTDTHPDAESCWERRCDKRFKTQAFVRVADWQSCGWRAQLSLCFMVDVDDLKFSGPTENLAKRLEFIRNVVKIEAPSEPGLFLGCLHAPFETIIDGMEVNGYRYNMSSHLRDTVLRRCGLARDLARKSAYLLTRAQCQTPFLDHTRSRHRQVDLSLGVPHVCVCVSAL